MRNAKILIKTFVKRENYLQKLIAQKNLWNSPCILCSIFEVLLCHLNKSSFFTFINVWWREFDFISYLFKFLPVHPQYIRSIFALFSLNVRIIFSRNFCIFYFDFFAKQIKVKFCEKSEKFCIFARLQNARMKRNFRENFVLRETIFPYRWKP